MSQKLTDLMQSTAAEEEIKFYFVTKSGSIDDASEDLKYSFKIITDFSSSTENLQWLSEAECLSFDALTLTKENVFILEEFEGESFDHLSSTKAIVIGPRVLINCQLTNDVVPNISSPIYTLAMKDFIVCLSGISMEKRAEIHKLVGYMGGLSSGGLIESTTHLITNTAMSPKYEKAAARNMKIMSENWVFDVWNLSKIDDDSYRTVEFYQKHKFPIFHNLVITSTGITEADKNEIANLINSNGGTYSGSFKSKVTDILITQPNQKDSQKFKAAVKCRKECLMVDWIKDSVSKGYMLPFVSYRIYTGHASRDDVLNSTQATNRTLRTDIFNPDGTQLSAIMSDFSIAETTSALTPMKKSPPKQSNYKTVLNAIDIGLVKNAKGCLDGCTIWLCGFDASDTDKLKKIINIGGGTRIDEHGPDVEYVIVGKPNTAELTYLKSLEESNIVTMNWLAACINAKRCADPKEFIYKLQASTNDSVQTVPSPASRKNIEDMNPFRRPGYVPRMLNMNDVDEEIKKRNEKTLLDQYSQPTIVKAVNVQREETNVCGETAEESDQIDPNLFRGVIFALFAFSEESTQELLTEIEEAGGTTIDVNDFSKTVNYLIVPSDTYDIGDCGYKAKEIVTELWIQECLGSNALVDIKYYHRAIIVREDCKPLSGLTIVFSTYTTPERDFLYSLAQALGGVVNDRYMRNQKPILICPTPLGNKYFGAIKWNLPVVTCEWLRECLKQRANVPMEKYAVADPKRTEKENSSDNAGSEQTEKFEKSNKASDDKTTDPIQPAVDADDVKVSENKIASPMTPAQHPRVTSLKSVFHFRSPGSPKTPERRPPSDAVITPITELVDCIESPRARKMIYDMYKEADEAETPLTKRRKREEATDSPPPSLSKILPNVFDIIDRNFVEVPKPPDSTPFVEYRKRMYRKFLGKDYDGTPLRAPINQGSEKENPQENHEIAPQPASTVVEQDNATAGQEKGSGDGATQVINFMKEVEGIKNRSSRTSCPSTQQMPTHDSPTDEEENPKEQHDEMVGWNDPPWESERHVNESRSTSTVPMRFSLGATTIDAELKKKIEALGGTVCEESSAFDPSCTHLICLKLNQSEKTFSVIASGRWLLCPAYIEDSFAAGRFLNEEEYEWGNPKADPKLPNDIDVKTKNIARMNYKWRTELKLRSEKENRKVGIFSSIRAILHTNRKDSFKRLLEAGCGVVVDLKQPYTKQEDFQGITHCFVDKRMAEMSTAEKGALIAAGVHIVTMLYIQACVEQDVMPNVKDFAAR
ncbi:DNA topoisomerase 2-binding protein 1 isoform X1 [Bradysia coprophila]|uniref:DNA topoisomerase 2-binding protein 1 isoform X1 n=1 Tax=Bradysia coprophila TaxID=38358 RepID=UPI00187D768E|nr:DNA topoisomerase 2-binding protein 1 isoform X1 [Bradysia coprophila]XP_037044602.1 DNA topoisomerase 2-binding protein 1 isoform X1 [Bradysia coprophila]